MWYFWISQYYKEYEPLQIIIQPLWVSGTTDVILKLLEEGKWLN